MPDTDAVVPTDNYSMPYFSPLIFVPPIPFVPGNVDFFFNWVENVGISEFFFCI